MTNPSASRCPACKKELHYDYSQVGKCVFCNFPNSLHMLDTNWQGIDILAVSRRMRRLVIACLVFCALVVVHGIQSKIPALSKIPISFSGANWGFNIAGLVFVFGVVPAAIHLQAALGSNSLDYITNFVLLLFFPLSVVPIAWQLRRSFGAMRGAGLTPRLFGLSDDHIIRHFSADRCQGCGYDLTGNTSGVCPECGKRPLSPTISV